MTRKAYWSPLAIRSLFAMSDFVGRQWGEQVVNELHERVDTAIHYIQDYPGLGAVVHGTEFRKLVIHKNVSLFYLVEPQLIRILLVWDNRMNEMDLYQLLTKSK